MWQFSCSPLLARELNLLIPMKFGSQKLYMFGQAHGQLYLSQTTNCLNPSKLYNSRNLPFFFQKKEPHDMYGFQIFIFMLKKILNETEKDQCTSIYNSINTCILSKSREEIQSFIQHIIKIIIMINRYRRFLELLVYIYIDSLYVEKDEKA